MLTQGIRQWLGRKDALVDPPGTVRLNDSSVSHSHSHLAIARHLRKRHGQVRVTKILAWIGMRNKRKFSAEIMQEAE